MANHQNKETIVQKHFLMYMASYELRDKINLEQYRQNYMDKFNTLLKVLGVTITENKQNNLYSSDDDWKAKALERQRKRLNPKK